MRCAYCALRACRHHDIDANATIDAAEGLTAGAPVRHRKTTGPMHRSIQSKQISLAF